MSYKAAKTALLLHGWPQRLEHDNIFVKYFESRGYRVLTPDLFTEESVFTGSAICNYLNHKLASQRPDVVLGLSMGGLIAPQLVSKYPKAKLILVASGPRPDPSASHLKVIKKLVTFPLVLPALSVLKQLPPTLFYLLGSLVNPYRGEESLRYTYIANMKKNYEYIRIMHLKKAREIVHFLTTVDNTALLKTLKNKSLIITGKNDSLMPLSLSMELTKLLANSDIIINNSQHFDVFTTDNFAEMDRFLA